MIASRLPRQLLLSALFFSGAASAVGLGEITLHSRIGEPLRAEVPVSSGGEVIDATCFSLAGIPGADFPVITNVRTRLVRIGQDYRLILSGTKPIDEPVVAINLRAGCGFDLQREYVMLPGPPLATAAATTEIELPGSAVVPTPRQTLRTQTSREAPPESWVADSNDIPRAASKARTKRSTQQNSESNQTAKTPLPRDTLANVASGKDKIILGAAPDELSPRGGDPLAPINELDERVLKMETTLHLLNQEVDKLNTALALGAESRAMRQKLLDMQARESGASFLPSVQAAVPEAPVRPANSYNGWLELALGLLLGGTVSAGVAHLVSRRQVQRTHTPHFPKPRLVKPGKQRTAA